MYGNNYREFEKSMLPKPHNSQYQFKAIINDIYKMIFNSRPKIYIILFSKKLLKNLMKHIKLYMTLCLINNITRWVTGIGCAIILNIIYLKFNVLYCEELPVMKITSVEGEDFYRIKIMSKSEQMYVKYHIDKTLPLDKPFPSVESPDQVRVYVEQKARVIDRPIPWDGDYKWPKTEVPSVINNQSLLNTFNYNTFYNTFADIAVKATNREQYIIDMIEFFNKNVPSSVLPKNKEEIVSNSSPLNIFITKTLEQCPFQSETDVLTFTSFQAMSSTYGVCILENCIDKIPLVQHIYEKSHDRILEQLFPSE